MSEKNTNDDKVHYVATFEDVFYVDDPESPDGKRYIGSMEHMSFEAWQNGKRLPEEFLLNEGREMTEKASSSWHEYSGYFAYEDKSYWEDECRELEEEGKIEDAESYMEDDDAFEEWMVRFFLDNQNFLWPEEDSDNMSSFLDALAQDGWEIRGIEAAESSQEGRLLIKELQDYLCGKRSSFGGSPDAQENNNADALEIAKKIAKELEDLQC